MHSLYNNEFDGDIACTKMRQIVVENLLAHIWYSAHDVGRVSEKIGKQVIRPKFWTLSMSCDLFDLYFQGSTLRVVQIVNASYFHGMFDDSQNLTYHRPSNSVYVPVRNTNLWSMSRVSKQTQSDCSPIFCDGKIAEMMRFKNIICNASISANPMLIIPTQKSPI